MDALDVVFALVALLWCVLAARGLADLAAVPDLPRERASGPPPSVTVVVPARDEEARIGTTVERLLAQTGVELELVVVDDRSRDRTAEIAAEIASRDARVRLVRVTELPEGWLGKPHACQRGAEEARSEWILFTDGDVWLAPDVLDRSIAAARAPDARHVTLAARLANATLLAQAGVAAFAAPLVAELARANRDRPRSGAGIGAFNLVRA
ncbi:MAG: glycosyltransferase family 2 protein, partial [Planctomycetes bacterium]|nr:glycosyltransferase family 2 protein [Planctomycetota bacterium]